jgi:hypothetical protein
MYPWVKRGGKLTPHTRGIVFGMQLHGAPASEIADRMGMTTTGVEYSIAISQGIVTGARDEQTPRGDTTPNTKDIQQRRRRVSSLMRKREIRRVWNTIPQRDIDALVLGFPQRVERMRPSGGEDCQVSPSTIFGLRR